MRQKETQLEDNLLSLTIRDGVGSCTVVFDTTDVTFIERLYKIFEALDTKQTDMEDRVKQAQAQPGEIFALARELDAEIRQMLDGTLGAGTCQALWGDINSYAYAGGLPKWANLLLAILDECSAGYDTQMKLTSPRLEKYKAKYHK